MSEHDWTEKQGQYLAFIYNYSVIHGQPPSEADMQRPGDAGKDTGGTSDACGGCK